MNSFSFCHLQGLSDEKNNNNKKSKTKKQQQKKLLRERDGERNIFCYVTSPLNHGILSKCLLSKACQKTCSKQSIPQQQREPQGTDSKYQYSPRLVRNCQDSCGVRGFVVAHMIKTTFKKSPFSITKNNTWC